MVTYGFARSQIFEAAGVLVLHVFDLGEPFKAQQIFGEILRGKTDRWGVEKAYMFGLWGRFGCG